MRQYSQDEQRWTRRVTLDVQRYNAGNTGHGACTCKTRRTCRVNQGRRVTKRGARGYTHRARSYNYMTHVVTHAGHVEDVQLQSRLAELQTLARRVTAAQCTQSYTRAGLQQRSARTVTAAQCTHCYSSTVRAEF